MTIKYANIQSTKNGIVVRSASYGMTSHLVIEDILIDVSQIGITNDGDRTNTTVNKGKIINCSTGLSFYGGSISNINNLEIVATDIGVSSSGYNNSINNLTIVAKNRGVSVGNGLTIITGCSITSTDNTGIYLDYYGKVEVDGVTVKGKEYGVQAAPAYSAYLSIKNSTVIGENNSGIYANSMLYNGYNELIVESGTIKGKIYGIYTKRNLALGINDFNIQTNNLIVEGENYGLYIDGGKSNFYDGILKGKAGAFFGEFAELAYGADLSYGTQEINNEEYQTSYLSSIDNFVTYNGVEYNSLQEAIDAVPSTGKIELIANAESKSSAKIPSNKDITIDLAGFTYTTEQKILNEGKLKIEDSSALKTGTLSTSVNINLIENKKILTIDSIKLSKTSPNEYVIYNDGYDANATINNIDLTSDGYGIRNCSNAKLTINNGEINASVAVNNGNSSRATLNNLTITATNIGVELGGGSNETLINDCTIVAGNRGVQTSYASNVRITGGTITGNNDCGIYSNYFGDIHLKDTYVTGYTYGVYIGHIYGAQPSYEIETSTVIGQTNSGIYSEVNNNKIDLKSGTIKGKENGIQVNNTLNIGVDDNNIQNDLVTIIGEQYGLKISNGETNYYEGVIKGKDGAYDGVITKLAVGSVIENSTETIDGEEYQKVYLEEKEKFVTVDGVEYNSLQAAIDAISSTGTIEFFKSASSKSDIEIPSTKNIIIDLKGKEFITEQTIVNKGVLTIRDTSTEKTGTISTSKPINLIKNEKELTVINGNFVKNNETNSVINSYSTSYQTILNIEDINIDTTGMGIVLDHSRGYINKANITNSSKGIVMHNITLSDFNIQNVNVNSSDIALELYNASKVVTLTNCNLSGGNKGINIESSIVNIIGGSISSDNGIGADLKAATATFKNTNVSGNTYGIYSRAKNYIGDNITIENSNITGTVNAGIYSDYTQFSYGKRTIEIKSGTIKGGDYGIYENNKLILGVNDDTIDNTNLKVIGNLYGLYVDNGIVEYYDGSLEGKNKAYNYETNETISIIKNGYVVGFSTDIIDGENYELATLTQQNIFVSNGSNTYRDLNLALGDAQDGDTLTITQNATVHYEINIDKEITLDLDGHELYITNPINNNSEVEIKSDTAGAKIKTTFVINNINNYGTLTINNVAFENTTTAPYVIENKENATLTGNSITIDSDKGIHSFAGSVTNLNSSTLDCTDIALHNSGVIKINGGTITGTNYAIFSLSVEDSEIKNATLVSNKTAIYNNEAANFEIISTNITGLIGNNKDNSSTTYNGGTLVGTIDNKGEMSLTNILVHPQTYTGDYTATFITNTGTFNTTGGEFIFNKDSNNSGYITGIDNKGTMSLSNTKVEIEDIKSKSNNVYTIKNYDDGVLNLNNTNIKTTGGITSYGIYTTYNTSNNYTSSTVGIKGGNIKVNESTNAYGIYVDKGDVTLGEKDGVISTTIPYVEAIGSVSGIGVKKVDGLFKYYDGKILGSTNAKPDTTTDTETYYEATFYHDADNYEYCILELIG